MVKMRCGIVAFLHLSFLFMAGQFPHSSSCSHREVEEHSPKGIASVCGRGLGEMKNIRKPYHSLMLNLISLMKVDVDKERVWRRVRVDKEVVLCINELHVGLVGIVH